VRKLLLIAALALAACTGGSNTGSLTLLNVSYDPTREFYEEFNADFVAAWKAEHGTDVRVNMSHGGSGKQARAVIDGLEADVVTLALQNDIDTIAKSTGKIPADWRSKLPNNSAPYTSTVVFVVKAGNPKGIRDWGDLATPGVGVVLPNPKTSGGARWNYLAAWAWADRQYNKDEAQVRDFVGKVYKNAPVLDTGARGSTTSFAQRGIGDVLVTWENEAYLALEEFGADKYEIIYPSISILAEPPVALVQGNAEKHGTVELSTAYLQHLYSPAGQRLAAKHFFRPSDINQADIADRNRFRQIEMVKIDDLFGGWEKAQATHFDEGGIYDQIFRPAQ
jgi:sulfate transport system substrate-binding protein